MTTNRITTICIDIGMTASAVYWKASEVGNFWNKHFDNTKKPTMVAYDKEDEDGPPVGWGKEYLDQPAHIQVQQCFKAFMDEECLRAHNSQRAAPVDLPSIHRWMLDFIHLLCVDVAATIDHKHRLGHDWKDGTVRWIFTFPGTWREFPVRADFRQLAKEAVYRAVGVREDVTVTANVTEALASAQCVLVNGLANTMKQYAPGNTVLSCDIGGATTDIAVCQIETSGRLNVPMQLKMHPAGVMDIDAEFVRHVSRVLGSAGALHPVREAESLSREPFRSAKGLFTGQEANKWVSFSLSDDCEAGDWPPAGNTRATATKVQQRQGRGQSKKLLIHQETMVGLFAPFVAGIEQTVDSAINQLAQEGTSLSAISICGGGARMAYPLLRFQHRYGDQVTILGPQACGFLPEMATVIGSTMLRDQQVGLDFCNRLRVGLKQKDDGVTWGAMADEPVSNVRTPFTKKVTFIGESHSVRSTIKHEIVVVPGVDDDDASPAKFSQAVQSLGARCWTVKIDLSSVGTEVRISLRKKYLIICRISGEWVVDFVAKTPDNAATGKPEKPISCTSVRTGATLG